MKKDIADTFAENHDGQTLYTLLVYSENIAGVLNQVTAVFTRRQVNIESLNVSASSINGIHKYTITCWSTEEQIVKITKAIEKKIDVVKADFYTDDELFIHEEDPEISRCIRHHDGRMMEVNPTYTTVLLAGLTDEVTHLYSEFKRFGCLLQYTRSGRIALTRSTEDPVVKMLEGTDNE